MAPETHTTRLARFCTDDVSYRTLPDEPLQRAKEFLLDSLGIAIRATEYDSSQPVLGAVQTLASEGSGTATVWGTGETRDPRDAALLNGTFVHTLETDDTHSEGIIHPAASVIPAALAVAEHHDADGRDLLAGIVAGYEVAIRCALALPASAHADRGFHPTATCGSFGATAAGAVVTGTDTDTLENAFGVNVSQTSGSKQWNVDGAWTKRLHPGLAASDGVLAVTLANEGFRGSADALTGRDGFLNLYGVDAEPDRVVDGLGDSFEISRTGIKPYACCRYNHTPIDVTLQVATEHDIDPTEVEKITLAGSRKLATLSPPEQARRPANVVEAQFSPHYAVAVALTDRAAQVDQYTRERLDDPELLDLMDRTEVVEDESMTARHPEEWPARIVVETERGTFSAEQALPSGDPEHRLSPAELREKFRTLTDPVLDGERQNAIIQAVERIDRADGVEQLGRVLREGRPVVH